MSATFNLDKDIFVKDSVAYWRATGKPLTQKQIDYVLNWEPGSAVEFPDMDLGDSKKEKAITDITGKVLEGVANAQDPSAYIDSLDSARPGLLDSVLMGMEHHDFDKEASDFVAKGDIGQAYKLAPEPKKEVEGYGFLDLDEYVYDYLGVDNPITASAITDKTYSDLADYGSNVGYGALEVLDYGEDILNFLARHTGNLFDKKALQSDLIPREKIDKYYKENPDDKPIAQDFWNLGVDFLDADKMLFETFFGEGSYFDAPYKAKKY